MQAIDDERILSEIGMLFVEGFETTGHTISWTLFNVATTPGVQVGARRACTWETRVTAAAQTCRGRQHTQAMAIVTRTNKHTLV